MIYRITLLPEMSGGLTPDDLKSSLKHFIKLVTELESQPPDPDHFELVSIFEWCLEREDDIIWETGKRGDFGLSFACISAALAIEFLMLFPDVNREIENGVTTFT